MNEHPDLQVLKRPPFVQKMKDEAAAFNREAIQTALDAVPPRDLERLRQQLTPLAKRPFIAEDRHEYTRIIQEWGMRGLPDYAPIMLMEALYDEHRAEREPKARPFRRCYEQLYAPWFGPEAKPVNPGLHMVERPPSGAAASCIEGISDGVEFALNPERSIKKHIHKLGQKLIGKLFL